MIVSDYNCPKCNQEFECRCTNVDQKTICPYCNAHLHFRYDCIYNEETGDEWDDVDIIEVSKEDFEKIELELVKSEETT